MFEPKRIVGFENYYISEYGEVINSDTGHELRASLNQQGILAVTLYKNRIPYRRSLAHLVASTYVKNPNPDFNDTVIHLDGNRENVHIPNLDWRPRWFAIMYHKQFKNQRLDLDSDIRLEETQEVYLEIRTPAKQYGLLESDIYLSLVGNRQVFPYGFHFTRV